MVDPTKLSDGLHYYEVYGVDCKAPWRGPIFRIPVTITKPMTIKNRPPLVSFARMSFMPGHFHIFNKSIKLISCLYVIFIWLACLFMIHSLQLGFF